MRSSISEVGPAMLLFGGLLILVGWVAEALPAPAPSPVPLPKAAPLAPPAPTARQFGEHDLVGWWNQGEAVDGLGPDHIGLFPGGHYLALTVWGRYPGHWQLDGDRLTITEDLSGGSWSGPITLSLDGMNLEGPGMRLWRQEGRR